MKELFTKIKKRIQEAAGWTLMTIPRYPWVAVTLIAYGALAIIRDAIWWLS